MITRDEVMAMTDEELQIKAAGLMGWTGVFSDKRSQYILGGPPWMDDDDLLKPVPDYHNDITAAWKLVDKLIEIDSDVEFSITHDTLREVGPWYMDGWMPASDTNFMASAETTGRAITRAFILAMDGEA